ncbi:translation initiation factor eIF 4e-like domain-containing protein [Cercophora scortea]|uniref:Translation initiation factor eIF 4e-like domain-containing protein n=1 Tax=Cercophora scortea TaxID=314031 RepID=A0AAE0ME13_9PEZI|nr:translation initiation factor eIF 4e-like domain-containing protein [Cercophora scortea]
MDSLWSRRSNTSKLSLSTPGSGAQGGDSPSGRSTTFSKRLGGDSSSHGKSNPFNNITTQSPGGLASPTANASSAFGLGSGAFASFGAAKTPKSSGNPFDATPIGSAKTPSAEKSAKDGGLGSKAIGKPASNASLAESNKTTTNSVASTTPIHQLHNSWVFWFRPPISKANGFIEYEKTLHPIASCDTAEEFFTVYEHLKRPSTLPLVSDYHLFKKGIRPIWEDEENKRGGKWVVRLKKGVADRYWEDLLLGTIGDQYGDERDDVCGIVLSVRNGEDILSIWCRTQGQRCLKIREAMKRCCAFPPDTKMEWKSHDSSIQQRTAIEESRREKGNNHHHHGDKRSSNNNNNKQQEDDQKTSLNT